MDDMDDILEELRRIGRVRHGMQHNEADPPKTKLHQKMAAVVVEDFRNSHSEYLRFYDAVEDMVIETATTAVKSTGRATVNVAKAGGSFVLETTKQGAKSFLSDLWDNVRHGSEGNPNKGGKRK